MKDPERELARICSPDDCGYYTGPDVGYCHRFRVILTDQEKKDFYSMHCGSEMENIEMLAAVTRKYLTRTREKDRLGGNDDGEDVRP
jgi:hypothetical protein